MAFSLWAVLATMALAIAPSLQTSVPVSTVESYSTVYSQVPTTAAPASTSGTQTGCPTVTLTSSVCSTCATPACIELEALTQSCDCPSAIPTVFVDFPCGDNACAGIGCAADYVFFTANCTAPTSTSASSLNTTSTAVPSTGTGVGGANSTSTGTNGTAVISTTSTVGTSGSSSTASGTSLASTASVALAGRMRPFWMGWM